MIVVIGSNAAILGGYHAAEPNDLDIIGEYNDVIAFIKQAIPNPKSVMPTNRGKNVVAKSKDGLIIEAEIAWPGSLAEQLMALIKVDQGTKRIKAADIPILEQRQLAFTADACIPSLNVQFMLKMSHRFLKNSPHFAKTRGSILEFQNAGAFIEPAHFEFYKAREAATYDYNHPSLNRGKLDFFSGDGVKYVYDHDSIHVAVKHLDRPAYQYFKPVNSEVMCSREMFELLPHKTKLYAVLEEAYVLAAERSQLAFPDGKITVQESFMMALEKVCTSITSGWFRQFAWTHYGEVVGLYQDDYMDRIYMGARQGIVKPYDPETQY